MGCLTPLIPFQLDTPQSGCLPPSATLLGVFDPFDVPTMNNPFSPSRRTVLSWGAAGLCLPLTSQAAPETWPHQPITLVIGFSKGSVSEVLASTLAEPMSRLIGQPVKIEVAEGKSGTLAAARVAKSTDAHTVAIVIGNTLTVAKSVDPSLSYEPSRDLRPVAFTSDDAMVLVASAREPSSTSATNFLAAARVAGDQWQYGSQGVGSVGHLGMEYLGMKAGLKARHVPFNNGPQILDAIRAGQVQMGMVPVTVAKRSNGRMNGLKAIAVTSYAHSDLQPELPSLHEAGVIGFDYRVWSAMVVPRRWTEAQVNYMVSVMDRVLHDKDVDAKLRQQGVDIPSNITPAQVNREILRETRLLGGIASIRNIAK